MASRRYIPLTPGCLRTCFIDGKEFFAAIEAERSQDVRHADLVDEANGSSGETRLRLPARDGT